MWPSVQQVGNHKMFHFRAIRLWKLGVTTLRPPQTKLGLKGLKKHLKRMLKTFGNWPTKKPKILHFCVFFFKSSLIKVYQKIISYLSSGRNLGRWILIDILNNFKKKDNFSQDGWMWRADPSTWKLHSTCWFQPSFHMYCILQQDRRL